MDGLVELSALQSQTRRSLSARKSVSSRNDNSEGELLVQHSQTRRSLSARKSVSSRDDNSEGELLAQQSQTRRSLSARKLVSSRDDNYERELLAQQSQTGRSLSARKSVSSYKTLVLTYTVLKGLAPNYLQELLKLRCPGRTLRSSSLSILDKPLSQTVTYGTGGLQWPQQTAGTHFPMRLRTPNHWHHSDVSWRPIFLNRHF